MVYIDPLRVSRGIQGVLQCVCTRRHVHAYIRMCLCAWLKLPLRTVVGGVVDTPCTELFGIAVVFVGSTVRRIAYPHQPGTHTHQASTTTPSIRNDRLLLLYGRPCFCQEQSIVISWIATASRRCRDYFSLKTPPPPPLPVLRRLALIAPPCT